MFFLVRWRIRKPVEQGDHQMSQIRSLFKAHRDEMSSVNQTVFRDRLAHASELRQGLDPGERTCWEQIERAKQYRDYAEDTLRRIKCIVPPPP